MKNTSFEYLITSLVLIIIGIFLCCFTKILMITYDLSLGTAITFMLLIIAGAIACFTLFWALVIIVHDALDSMMVFDHIRIYIAKHKK